ncbi:MAG: TolC family protein, partial [Candidatus Binataceae bacterium]
MKLETNQNPDYAERDEEETFNTANSERRKEGMAEMKERWGYRRVFAAAPASLLGMAMIASAAPAQEKADVRKQDTKASQGMTMQEPMHQHGNLPLVEPEYPQMGRAQQRAGTQMITLDQAEKMAEETNPTLRQADEEIRAAKARQQQAGLYPNPSLGYTGDEIRGGTLGGGKQGFFVQQTIVTGGKLSKTRAVFGADAKLAEIEAQEQRTRVETAVKMAFLRVLAAQEWLDARRDLAKIAESTAQTQRQLINT